MQENLQLSAAILGFLKEAFALIRLLLAVLVERYRRRKPALPSEPPS